MSQQTEISTGVQVAGTIVIGLITIISTCAVLMVCVGALTQQSMDRRSTPNPNVAVDTDLSVSNVAGPMNPTMGDTPFERPRRTRGGSSSFGDIFTASMSGTVQDVKDLLEKGSDVNARDIEDDTPLHKAAYRGNIEVCKFLVDMGAYVNAQNNSAETPLDLAKKLRRQEVVTYLSSRVDGTLGGVSPELKLESPTITVSAISSDEIKVIWNPVDNAHNYKIQYATDSVFAARNVSTVESTATLQNITGLNADTTYYVRVMAANTGKYSNSDYSITESTTTAKLKLETPVIINGAWGKNKIGIVWTNVNNADSYRIEYTTDQNFNAGITAVLVGASPTSITGINANTTYYVRVKAIGVGFTDSDYSVPVWYKTSR